MASPVPHPSTQAAPDPAEQEARRRRRSRNIAMLVVLIGLSVLFYAITVVKMAKPGVGG